jgi:hypothetical protein
MLSRFLMTTALVGIALGTAMIAGAAPLPTNFDSSAMIGNEAEDAIAVNPTNPSNVVTMSTLPGPVAGLSSNVSFNGGRSWRRGVIGGPGDPLGEICCDQQLAWDSFGNLWMVYLLSANGNVPIALSTDGGLTFRKVFELQTGFGDQPSIAVGANSVWVSFTSFPGTDIEAFGARVTGLGQFGAFTAPQSVPSHGKGDYGDTAVGPEGQLMVTYQDRTGGESGAHIYVAVDPDGLGPAGFNDGIAVARTRVGGFDYIPAQPHRSVDAEANLAWDRSGGVHDGRVYLVWGQETANENDDIDVMLQYSDDDGTTWSLAVRLNDDHTANSQFMQAIALDQTTGAVAVSWYDTRNDLGAGGGGDTNGFPNDDTQIWATYSTNGGSSFAPNFRVSRGTSNASYAQTGFDYGDYTHAAFQSGTFFPAWSDNSNSVGGNPDGTLHKLDLYTARVSIP